MRTVSFSKPQVRDILAKEFVCCVTNTKGDPSAGASFKHAPNDPPGPCGRGAGRQNVQTFFTTAAGEIFHVASGYLSGDDLLEEIEFAQQIFAHIRKDPLHAKELVAAAHRQHLRRVGFSDQEINAPDNMFTDMQVSMLSPQDFGLQIPSPPLLGGKNPAFRIADARRQRGLKDHRFLVHHPLILRQAFQEQPQLLVGHGKTFFGTMATPNAAGFTD